MPKRLNTPTATRERIRTLYVDHQLSIGEVASLVKLGKQTVVYYLKKQNVQMRAVPAHLHRGRLRALRKNKKA